MIKVNRNIKFGIITFILVVLVILLIWVLIYIEIIVDFYTIVLIPMILFPYSIALFIEYSINAEKKQGTLSEGELNLIQEYKNIIKSLEIIIISFSFLFGLFTSIQFDLQLAGNASYQLMRLLASLFGVNFFMATFVFIQTQVLGKDAYLRKEEIELLKIGSSKTSKIVSLVNKMRFANFVRKGCYYSLLIQISLVYPIIIASVSL